jgi:hypothetical protein
MRTSPQISAASIVALGHFNPLIFGPNWLKEKEIVVGNDFENLKILIVHPDIVSYQMPWGNFQTDRNNFTIGSTREPLVRVHDFFVRCFQFLPETPISAVGINREVHFETASEAARDRAGDVLAPKDFWGDFVESEGQKTGGLRSIIMEQSIAKEGRRARVDGKFGHVWARVEPSSRRELRYGIFMQVNDHFDVVTAPDKLSDGRAVADLVAEQFERSITNAERLIDRVMELADARA